VTGGSRFLPDPTDLEAAWSDFADRMKTVGRSLTGDAFPFDPRMRAEGYRYLGRLISLARQIYIDFGDPSRPCLFRYGDDITPFGATNVDNNYYRAAIDPAGTYRISGDVEGVKELLFSVQDGEFVLGRTAVLAEASLGDLELGADGALELVLGGPERGSNWLPLDTGAEYINVREFVADWEHDALASLYIERVDAVGPAGNPEPAAMATALDRAATWVEASIRVWNQFGAGLRTVFPTNSLTPPRPAEGGALNMLHGGCQWDLEPGQALVIELERPEVTYWSIQTYLLEWLLPLDFANRVTSLNDRQVHVDGDGRVRVVLADDDPGVQNWLDTSGLRTGLMTYRYVRPTTAPAPTSTVAPLDEVRRSLPASTPVFSAADRRAQIGARRRGVARRFRR